MRTRSYLWLLCFGALVFALSCGSSEEEEKDTDPPDDTDDTSTYSVSCEVSGLDGALGIETASGVSETVEEDGTLELETDLEDGTDYEISLTESPFDQDCSVENGTGTIDGEDVVASCTCENQPWDHPGLSTSYISLPDGDGSDARVAFGGQGTAAIVWKQSDETNTDILMSFFKNDEWTHPTSTNDRINSSGSTGTGFFDVDINASGEAILAWAETDETDGTQIYVSLYESGSWSAAERLSPLGQNANSVKAKISDNGEAVVAWIQADGSDLQLFKSDYRSSSWDKPSGVTDNVSPDGEPVQEFDLAIDDDGNAILAWTQWDGSTDCGSGARCERLFLIEYRGSSWTTATSLSSDAVSLSAQDVVDLSVDMDDNDNALVAWLARDPSLQLFVSEYRSSAWTHPTKFSDVAVNDVPASGFPEVAMSNTDEAVMIFRFKAVTDEQVHMSEYRSSKWTHDSEDPTQVSPSIGTGSNYMGLDVNSGGEAVIAWNHESDASESKYLLFSEYRDGSWTHPDSFSDQINPEGELDTDPSPEVALADDGSALIVWSQNDGTHERVFFSQYTPPNSI